MEKKWYSIIGLSGVSYLVTQKGITISTKKNQCHEIGLTRFGTDPDYPIFSHAGESKTKVGDFHYYNLRPWNGSIMPVFVILVAKKNLWVTIHRISFPVNEGKFSSPQTEVVAANFFTEKKPAVIRGIATTAPAIGFMLAVATGKKEIPRWTPRPKPRTEKSRAPNGKIGTKKVEDFVPVSISLE